MRIIEDRRSCEAAECLTVECISADGVSSQRPYHAAGEARIDITVEGCHAGTVPCTPADLAELAAGWLMYAGYITGKADISEIRITDGDLQSACRLRAEITLTDAACRSRHIDAAVRTGTPAKALPDSWEWLRELRARFETERPLRRETGATHSCMLVRFRDGLPELLVQSEDTGRHSAMDKAVGWGILHGIDLSECVLFTSGRISEEMVEKAVSAGVMALTTGKPLVSTGAAAAARQNALLLAGTDLNGNVLLFSRRDHKDNEKSGTTR